MAEVFIGQYEQGSRETLDYSINWGTLMTAESDSVASSVWYAEHGNPTIGDGANGASAPGISADTTTAWIVGGTVGDKYHVTNVVTSTAGRKFEASIKITITDK
jgi:hypothetical protein